MNASGTLRKMISSPHSLGESPNSFDFRKSLFPYSDHPSGYLLKALLPQGF